MGLKVNSKIHFKNGHVEFVGLVSEVLEGAVMVSGVERGCMQTRLLNVRVDRADVLREVDENEWVRLVKNEPAFAGYMPKETFISLLAEREEQSLNIAVGEDSEYADLRIREIDLLIESAPWIMCPKNGCIKKPNATTVGC